MTNEITFDERIDREMDRLKGGDFHIYEFTDDFVVHEHYCPLHDASVKCLVDPCPYGGPGAEIHCQKCTQQMKEGTYDFTQGN